MTNSAAQSSFRESEHLVVDYTHPLEQSIVAINMKTEQKYSFTVSYLVNSCEFSPESAVSASKTAN